VLSEQVVLTATPTEEAMGETANPTKRPSLPGYVGPSIEIIYYPERPNLFDGFTVSGQAYGSELQGAFAYVTVAGVTRRAKIIDGLWTVIFEDDALPRHYSGHKEIVAQFRDNVGKVATASVSVYIEDFIDSFIIVDNTHKIVGDGIEAQLHISGELNLGTHLDNRELQVTLVSDDEAGHTVAIGELEPGWQHGEWRAAISLKKIIPGEYRVRAQLSDGANAALTRVMCSPQVILL